ncbi:MAG: BamA/TamA family outer membrane protein [Planctomycetota bacterium]
MFGPVFLALPLSAPLAIGTASPFLQDEPVAPSAGAVEAEPDAEGESEAADDAAPKKTSGSRFKDPTDGMFDLTLNFSKGGFVPIPFLITEPAVGFGGGAAALFIHERNVEDPWYVEDTSAVNAPPNATVVMGAGTENGTWLAAVGHQGVWKDDTIRYMGALATGQINLDLFVGDTGFGYGLETVVIFQDIRFRVGDTDLFLGANYRFASSEANFRDVPPELFPAIEQNDAGAGLVAQWDTRDNYFTPHTGQDIELQGTFWNEAFGGDANFGAFQGKGRAYFPIADDHTLGVRVQVELAGDDAPFYLLPSIRLRGVPFARYQGTEVGSTEAEFRYAFTPRWEGLAFGGVGTARDSVLPNSGAIWAGGLGFRYLLARPFGISAGLDLAVGPEQGVIYIAVGSGL